MGNDEIERAIFNSELAFVNVFDVYKHLKKRLLNTRFGVNGRFILSW